MAVIVTKESDSEVHGYLLWKEDGTVEQIYCGPLPAIIQSLGELYSIAGVLFGLDDDVSRRELTELLEVLIDELTTEQVVEQLDLDVTDLNGIRGPVTVETIIESNNLTLDYWLLQEDRIILCEDIPDGLSPRNTVPAQVDQSSSPEKEIEENQDLRVECERDYSERVTQDRGHDPYTDEVKALYHNQCAFCGLKVEMPKGEYGENYALESAHIQRAADDGPDTPRNRIALCPFHHWAFDNGWVSLTDDHTVLVKDAPEYDGHDRLKALHGKQILLPNNSADHPHSRFLQIHREKHGFTD